MCVYVYTACVFMCSRTFCQSDSCPSWLDHTSITLLAEHSVKQDLHLSLSYVAGALQDNPIKKLIGASFLNISHTQLHLHIPE